MKEKNIPIVKHNSIGHIGGKGSYSHEAAKKYFKEASYKSFPHFENVFRALDKGIIDYGVLPIENSSTGGIRDVYDLLIRYNQNIVGEIYLSIKHHLIGLPGASIDNIKTVCSHPQGIMQSSDFIRFNNYDTKICSDTGSAAAFVKEYGDPTYAAIASASASQLYNLEIIKKNTSDKSHNSTRFFVLSNTCASPSNDSLTSLVFTTKHEPGCLYNALKYLADYGINMLRIESRPMDNHPWEYYFFVDIEGSHEDILIKSALEYLKKQSNFFRILGSYKRSQKDI